MVGLLEVPIKMIFQSFQDRGVLVVYVHYKTTTSFWPNLDRNLMWNQTKQTFVNVNSQALFLFPDKKDQMRKKIDRELKMYSPHYL